VLFKIKEHMRSRGLHGGHLGVEIFPSKNEEDPNNIFYMDCYYFSSIHTHTYTLTVLLAVLLYVADAIPRRCLPVDWQSHTEPERSGGGGEGTAATIRTCRKDGPQAHRSIPLPGMIF